jgi:hypothetical protein
VDPEELKDQINDDLNSPNIDKHAHSTDGLSDQDENDLRRGLVSKRQSNQDCKT